MTLSPTALTGNAIAGWYRSFGLFPTIGLFLVSVPLTGLLASFLAKGDPLISPVLWVVIEMITLVVADGLRVWRVGSPCGRGASSRWQRRHELKATKYTRGAIFLGTTSLNSGPVGFKLGVLDDRHVLTFAPNRSGKGTRLVIPNLLLWGGAVLATDPKGELAEATWEARQEAGHIVAAVDPYGVLAERNGGKPLGIEIDFNLIGDLDRYAPDIAEQINSVVAAIVVDEGAQNIHWTEGASLSIVTAIALVLLKAPPEQRSMKTVADLLKHRADFLTMLELASREPCGPKALWSIVEAGHAQIDGLSDTVRDNWLSTATRNLGWLTTSVAMQKSVSCSTRRSMKDLAKGNLTIYLVLPPDKLAEKGAWLRVIVKKALVACVAAKTKPKIPVLLLLDEFAQLGFMKEIEDALGILAGFGIKLWPILQDLGQLKRVYPKSWESFIAASGSTQVFASQDPETCKLISEMCGNRHRRQWEDKDLSRSDPNAVPLLTPDEVRRVTARANGHMVVFNHGQHPALIKGMEYYSRSFQRFLKSRLKHIRPDQPVLTPDEPNAPPREPEEHNELWSDLPWLMRNDAPEDPPADKLGDDGVSVEIDWLEDAAGIGSGPIPYDFTELLHSNAANDLEGGSSRAKP